MMTTETGLPHQKKSTKQFRHAKIIRQIRFTEETYAILAGYKDNVEQLTGSRLSDAFAIEAVLLGLKERVANGEI